MVVRGIHSRISAAAVVREKTLEQAIPSVSVIHPKRGELKEEISLPGNIMAFVDAPVYARTSGYLKKWYTDIGTRVKTGQLLAEIDSPEVDQQLAQGKGAARDRAGQSEAGRDHDESRSGNDEGRDSEAGRGQRGGRI